jgi:hypothetical protein
MTDFSVQIDNFQSYGTYNYRFDEAGNEILNPSSSLFQEHYIAFPTINMVYDHDKIQTFYQPTLTEFTPSQSTGSKSTLPQDIIDQINDMTQKNQVLANQLDDLIAKSELTSAEADSQLVKDIIMTLRIQLGQGTSTTDFFNEFPYLPIPIDQRDTTTL